MKMILAIVFLFSVSYLSYQKPAYSYEVYEFTATITESYEHFNSAWGEFYEGDIRRNGWQVGDSFSGTFVYDLISAEGGRASYVSFLNEYGDGARFTITNDNIDTFIVNVSSVEGSADEYIALTIIDPTGTLVAGNSNEGLPDSLNMANSTLFDVSIEYIYSYEGPADWYSLIRMNAVGHIESAPVPAPVPLPSVLLLFGSGLAGLIVVTRHRGQNTIVSNTRPG